MSAIAKSARAVQLESLVALVLALTPFYFFSQIRGKLGLDGLHIGLLQSFILLLFSFVISTRDQPPLPDPSTRSLKSPLQDIQKRLGGGKGDSSETDSSLASVRRSHKRRRTRTPSTPPSLYPASLLEDTVRSFLAIADPAALALLPPPSSLSTSKSTSTIPVSEWTILHQDATIKVCQCPDNSYLYSIAAEFKNVPLRKLYETLTSLEKRREWDSMCSGTEELEAVVLREEGSVLKTGLKHANVAWVGMKGLGAIIRAKDLVLLGVEGSLPPTPTSKTRIFCSTTSVEHPSCPPKPDFSRLELAIAGFLVEETEDGLGSRIFQLTDLSCLGSWVPTALVRKITTTVLPKSLAELGRTAAAYNFSDSRYPIEGQAWVPPLLGSPSTSTSSEEGPEDTTTDVEYEEDNFVDDEEDSDDSLNLNKDFTISPDSARDLQQLLSQLRTVTTRLSILENSTGAAEKGKGKGTDQDQMTHLLTNKMIGWLATGITVGAASAAVAWGIWNRRRK